MTDPAFDAALEAVRAAKSTKQTIDACDAFARARDARITCEEANQLLRNVPFQMRRVDAVRALAGALVDFESSRSVLGRGFRDWESAELEEAARSAREPGGAYGRLDDASAPEAPAPAPAPKAIEATRRAVINMAMQNDRARAEEMTSAEALRRMSAETRDEPKPAGLLYTINLGLLDELSVNFDTKTGPLGRLKFEPGGPKPPPELERRGLSKREWAECVDALWSALETHPFHGKPAMECVACCCPLGPLTFIINHFNPFCWYLYCPYYASRDRIVKKLNDDVLAPRDVVAKVNRNVVQFFDRSVSTR